MYLCIKNIKLERNDEGLNIHIAVCSKKKKIKKLYSQYTLCYKKQQQFNL